MKRIVITPYFIKIRKENLSKNAENLVKSHVKDVINDYDYAIEN